MSSLPGLMLPEFRVAASIALHQSLLDACEAEGGIGVNALHQESAFTPYRENFIRRGLQRLFQCRDAPFERFNPRRNSFQSEPFRNLIEGLKYV